MGDDMAETKDLNGGGEGLLTASLDQLQSSDYRQILDVVDSLRTCGLGTILQLPQIVVCGDQSSGKSSVLEAITEVPFPRKENLCTRFATEIVMRRDPKDSIKTKIIPDKTRTEKEITKLEAFTKTISNFDDLPDLIEECTELMGLNDASGTGRGTKAFTRDVLSIEIAGPNRLQLTLVDLPGLIMSAINEQTAEDVTLIHDLVDDYISESRTIILAVVTAKNDFANQAILTKCRKVDPEGQRTLGIVTKPDYLKTQASESLWIHLAQNKNVYFELGWHMLKNRSEEEMENTFEERNKAEAAFFAKGLYRDLPSHNKGIATLRTRLAQLLYRHLKKELPQLQTELISKYEQTLAALQHLGLKRSTPAEQKRFLMAMTTDYQAIVNGAAEGHYALPFFGSIDTTKGFEDAGNMRRLRAAVQHLNLQFAGQMRQWGHKFRVQSSDGTAGTNTMDENEPALMDEYAEAKSRKDTVEWVKELLVRTRGRELPGNFNPLLMSQLFWEQSEHWEALAKAHINRVHALCRTFVHAAINDVVIEEIARRLKQLKLDAALSKRLDRAMQELSTIIIDKQRTPSTYDPRYVATVQQARTCKTTARFKSLMDQAKVAMPSGTSGGEQNAFVNPEVLQNGIKELMDPNMDQSAAEDALDSQLAYYKDEVKIFIANITKQVVERHLLAELAEDTLSPLMVNDMSDQEVGYLAGEAEETTHKRDFLESQKARLEAGQEAFGKALGSYH